MVGKVISVKGDALPDEQQAAAGPVFKGAVSERDVAAQHDASIFNSGLTCLSIPSFERTAAITMEPKKVTTT